MPIKASTPRIKAKVFILKISERQRYNQRVAYVVARSSALLNKPGKIQGFYSVY